MRQCVKNKTTIQPNHRHITVLRQLCQFIPPYLIPKLARETGVDLKERTFSAWSHVVAMVYCQISHAWSLNDVYNREERSKTPKFSTPFRLQPASPRLIPKGLCLSVFTPWDANDLCL